MRKRIIGIIVGVVLVLAGTKKANAANGWEIPLNTTTTTTSQVTSPVSLSLNPGTIQTDLDAANAPTNPDEAGKVLSQTATITVGNTDGYTVYVSGNTNLTGGDNTNHKIPSITSSKTLGSMSNEWGYYGVLGDTEASYNPSTSFKAMTTSQQSVGTGEATSSSVTKKLTLFYGARVTSSAAEDFYGNTVTLSVIAQPRTVTNTVATFGGITTMQQMTPAICKAATINDTAFLTDERDGNKYWVTKMLDGNCWMSQNLDLDIRGAVRATYNADPSQTFTWTTGNYSGMANLGQAQLSNRSFSYAWDLGKYIITDPTIKTSCASTTVGLSECSKRFTNVTGWTASTDPNFYRNNSNSPVSSTTKTYDAHYLVGNYYQWNAATAGTGNSSGRDQNATASICPQNWKLPNANSDSNGSFSYYLQQYGITSNFTGNSNIDQHTYNIVLSPLFFVRSGDVSSYTSALGSAGGNGEYWSSRAHVSDSEYAYYLLFNSSTVLPLNYYAHGHDGRSIRCLVPTS